jgi:spermidine/putrescine transport system substrate-binding protein
MTNDQNLDPRTAAALRSALSRRTVLAGAGGVGLAAALAACGTGGDTNTGTAPATAEDQSETEKKLRWQNWVEYMDNEGGKGSTLERFEKETGIAVNYTTEIEGNESFTDTVQQQLERDQPTGYDIVVLTDWMAGKWILNGWALTLDKGNIPNWTNLRAQLQEVPFDEGREYTLPWQSGFAGIGVNKKLLKDLTGKSEIKTIEELWDPKLKGRVTVLDEMRDTIGLILMSQGKELSDFTDADFNAALDELQKQIDSGQVRQVTGNGYLADLESGQVAASTAWSGDLAGNPDLQWIVPESGATYWTDNMIIPQLAAHKLNAEKAMNFYYDPQNQADLILGGVTYVTPIPASQELVAKKDAELAENPIVFPTDEFLANTQIFKVLSPEQNDQYSQAFNDVIGA